MPLQQFSRYVLIPLLLALVAGACSDSQRPAAAASPTAPSAPTPMPAATTFTLTGTILDAHTVRPIEGATVRVTDGPNAGRTATTDSAGKYTLAALSSGSITLQIAAAGY